MGEARPGEELSTVGVVISHSSGPSYDRRVVYPSVRYQTADGRTIEFQSKLGSNAPPRVGNQVTVFYDPERPEDARISLGSAFSPNLKLLPVVFGIFLAFIALMFLSVFALVVFVSLA